MKGNNMTDQIKINRDEYLNLRIMAMKLQMLSAGGVNNWEWYAESLWPTDDEKDSIDKAKERIRKEVSEIPSA